MSLLAIDRLTVGYGARRALDGVSLRVAAGEIVALLGPSGSGKSTLAAAALGLLPDEAAVEGRVRVDGIDPVAAGDTVRGSHVGMVFQEPATALNPALTIGRQIGEVLARHTALDRRARASAVRALLARVGLDVAPGRYPHMLSGGQRQRVAIAIAIAAGPALLIADEPTAALDPVARAGIAALLRALAREGGMGLLIVSHDLALVAGLADRLVVLDDGCVVEEGAGGALLAAPRSDTLRRMVAALNLPGRTASTPGAMVAEAAHLGRSYGTALFGGARQVALADVALALRAGETLAVVGPSGSGKSTLARLLLGLERPDRGRVAIDGRAWGETGGRRRAALRRRVQAVFQDPAGSFDPRQRVGTVVAEPLALVRPRLSTADQAARAGEALAAVGLPADAATRFPDQFSGGQRQRIAIARALVARPDLIVLDEALSALDPAVRAEIVALLLRLQAERGLAYVFIAHDLALVRAMADRVMVLDAGRVIEEGRVADVLAAPRDPRTAALVAASAL